MRQRFESTINSPATTVANSTALLEGKQLLGSEALVMDLAGSLDQVLQMSTGEEVAKIDKFAVRFVFTVDDTPSVLSATDSMSIDIDGLLATDNGEGDQRLQDWLEACLDIDTSLGKI